MESSMRALSRLAPASGTGSEAGRNVELMNSRIRPSTVRNLVRRMEREGWISRGRTTTDQRTVRLRASPAGLAKLREIGPDAEYFVNLLAQLSSKEFVVVSRALELIASKLPEQL